MAEVDPPHGEKQTCQLAGSRDACWANEVKCNAKMQRSSVVLKQGNLFMVSAPLQQGGVDF